MSATAEKVLLAFDALEPAEKQQVAAEILRRSAGVTGLPDAMFDYLATKVFQSYDAEEAEHGVDHRTTFADFLDRLASGVGDSNQWVKFVVTHYRDERLEEVRRDLVRLMIQRAQRERWLEVERQRFREWSGQLRQLVIA